MARQRSTASTAKQRDWTHRHRALLARERATRFAEPAPDPVRQPREFRKWAAKYAENKPSQEMRQLLDELYDLPSLKYRRGRDEEVFSWILCLRIAQRMGAPFDLRTCSLGANPTGDLGKPSRVLRHLMEIVGRQYPEARKNPRFAARLFDGIRNWRKRRSELE